MSSRRSAAVRTGHPRIEHLARHRDQRGVRDPGAVVAGADLAQFVGAHSRQRLFVGDRIAGDRDLRRHAAHRVRAAAMAGLDQQFRIGLQEGLGHADELTVGAGIALMEPARTDDWGLSGLKPKAPSEPGE